MLTGHHPALVVEVAEDDVDTLVLLAEEVLNGHLDVVKGDEGGAGGRRVRGLDGLGLDALAAGDEEDAEALAGVDGSDEVVAEDTVGDPLLGAVDNVVLAVGGLLGGGADAGNVGAGEGLGDGQADLLLAAEDLVVDALLHGRVLAEVEDAGQADDHAGHVAVLEAAAADADLLLGDDHVVEVVELLAVDDAAAEQLDTVEVLAGTHLHVQDAGLGILVDELLGDVGAVPLALESDGEDVLVSELADGALQASVAVLEVGRLELGLEPEGLGVGDGRKLAELGGDDALLLALDGADGQVVVLDDHLVSVEVVEVDSGILAGDLAQDSLTTGMGVEELGDIVDNRVDNEPDGVLGVAVLGDLVAGEGLGGGGKRHLVCWFVVVVGGGGRDWRREKDCQTQRKEIKKGSSRRAIGEWSFLLKKDLQRHRHLDKGVPRGSVHPRPLSRWLSFASPRVR